jgi:hypothetical protein
MGEGRFAGGVKGGGRTQHTKTVIARCDVLPAISLGTLQMNSSPESATEFLNIDLDLHGRDGLDDLIDAFGASVFVLQRTAHQLSLEMTDTFPSADETLLGWVSLIERLSPRARGLWDQCELRSFNIGIRAGRSPHQMCFEISRRAVSLVADVQSEIAITVYAPS